MAITKVSRGLLNTGISDSSDATAITIDSGENVGIGTTSPSTFSGFKTLHFKNDSGDTIFLNESDGGVIGQIRNSDTQSIVAMGARSNHDLIFTTNDTERMRIDTSGNVGIGFTTPQAPLEVNQTNTECTHFGSTSTNSSNNFTGISLGYAETNSLNYRKVKIVSTGFGDGSARQNLDFLVDTNTDSNSAVLVDSKLTISGTTGVVSGDLNDTSDIGFKENITDVTESLSLIKQLQPRFFTWKDSKASRGESTGFIAQEVEKIIPLLVQGNDLGTITTADDGSELQDMSGKSINTIGLVGYLTKAIQELSAKVEELEGKIE